ncbi:MAG TPA: LptF/LptG family permease [Deltaproteobacteria bacterium]|nr:LptF/LptG family permease [Deltaproteobacteria bacterium]HPR50281.1 LptF/LptG family permease [Deltaproteobacteria bacterium]
MIVLRYVLNSLTRVFLASALVLYGVMFIVEWIRIGKFVSISDIDIFFFAMVPMAIFVLPMALLFSVLLVLERLSTESEIIAMKASGVHNSTLYLPIIVLSFVCMAAQMAVSTYLGPISMGKIQERLIEKAPEKIYAFLNEREFDDTFKGIIIYIESINQVQRELKNIFIETTGSQGSVITADTGTIDVNPTGIMMRLKGGSMFTNTKTALRYVTFDEYVFSIEANFGRQLSIRTHESATQSQLRQLIRENPRPKWIKEYHNRFAFPVLNIILGLIGISFGIQRPRSPRFTGFVVGISTILGYYMAFIFADRAVKGELLDPLIGAWMPNMVFSFVLMAIWLWRRAGLSKGGF